MALVAAHIINCEISTQILALSKLAVTLTGRINKECMMTIAAQQGLAASDVQPARTNKLLFLLPFIALLTAFFIFVYQKTEKLSAYHDHENFRILSQVAGGINEQLNSLVQMLNAKQSEAVIRNRFPSYQPPNNKKPKEPSGGTPEGGQLEKQNIKPNSKKIVFSENKVLFNEYSEETAGKTGVSAASVAVVDIIRQPPQQFSKIFISNAKGATLASFGADARLSAFDFTGLLNNTLCDGSRKFEVGAKSSECEQEYLLSRNDVMSVVLAGEDYRLYIYPFIVQVEMDVYNNEKPLYIIALIRNSDNNYLAFIKSPVVALLLFVGMLLIWCVFKIELQSVHHPIGAHFSKLTVFLFFITLALVYAFIMSQYYSVVMDKRRISYAKEYVAKGRKSIDDSIKIALSHVYSNRELFKELGVYDGGGNWVKRVDDFFKKDNYSFVADIYRGAGLNVACDGGNCNLYYVFCKSMKGGGGGYNKDNGFGYDCFSGSKPDSTERTLGRDSAAYTFFTSVNAPRVYGGFLKDIDYGSLDEPNKFVSAYDRLISCSSLNDSELSVCHYNFNSINSFGISHGVNFLYKELYGKPVIYDLNHRNYFTDLVRSERKYNMDGGYLNSVQRLKNIGDGTKGTTVSVLVKAGENIPALILNSDITASALDYFDPAIFDMSAFVVNKNTGIVQLHNDSSLELNENIYAQNSDNTNLEAYIKHEPLSLTDFAKIHGSYHGQTGVYLVSGMENSDWAYIVFIPDLPVNVYEKSIFISFFAIVVVFIVFYSILSFVKNRFFRDDRFKAVLLFGKKTKTKKIILYCFGVYLVFMSVACLVLEGAYQASICFVLAMLFFVTLVVALNYATRGSDNQRMFLSYSRGWPFVVDKGVVLTSLLMVSLFYVSVNLHKVAQANIENYVSDGLLNYYCIRYADNRDTMRSNVLANFKVRINVGDVVVSDLNGAVANNKKSQVSLNDFAPPQTSLGLMPDLRIACPANFMKKTPNPVASVIFNESNVFSYFSPLLSFAGGGRDYIPSLGDPFARHESGSVEKIGNHVATPQQAIDVISNNFFVHKFNHWSIVILLLSTGVFFYFCRIYDNYLSWVIFGRTGFKRDIATLYQSSVDIQSSVKPANLFVCNSVSSSATLPVLSYRDLFAPGKPLLQKNNPFAIVTRRLATLRSSGSWAGYDTMLDMMQWQVVVVGDDLVLICSDVDPIYMQNDSERCLYDFVADMTAAVNAGLLQGFVLCCSDLVLQQRLVGVGRAADSADASYRWLVLLRQFMTTECSPVNSASLSSRNAAEYVKSLLVPHPARVMTARDKKILHDEIVRIPTLLYLDSQQVEKKEANLAVAHSGMPDNTHSWLRHDSSIYGRNRLAVSWLTARAQYLYRYFWFHCSDQEKICLYFLATKGIFNPKNQATLEALAARGLVRMAHGRVAVVNQSFAHFVRHAESEPAMAALIKATERGSWHLYKYPLTVLVGLSIVAICIVGAQSLSYAVSSIVALVAMVAGVANNFSLIRNVVRAS